jgi:hypothetical protein
VPANSTEELVHSPAMRSVIKQRDNGYSECRTAISIALGKAALALKIEMGDDRRELIVDDILEEFQYDPIDMILMVLKKGRKGKYKDIQKTYRDLNLEVISEWMMHERELLMEAKHRENERKADEDYASLIREIPKEQALKLAESVSVCATKKAIEKESAKKAVNRHRSIMTENKYLDFLKRELPNMKRTEINAIRKQADAINAHGEKVSPEVVKLIDEHLGE